MSDTDMDQLKGSETAVKNFNDGMIEIYNSDVMDLYPHWEEPIAIVSDGGYGTGTFPGDPESAQELPEWYEDHIEAWSKYASPQTTLWFWNTEEGWAEVHPLLKEYGWEYRGVNIWDKGMSHIAGNSNTKKLRKFPQVTEVCVHYVKKAFFEDESTGEKLDIQDWVISEWKRTGLTLDEANIACGVADAASRKYLTKGDLWYFPPHERMEAMVEYANIHGDPEGRPYFAPDGENPIDADDWKTYRAKFDCPVGVTNVWNHPQLNGKERIKNRGKAEHLNQKPLELIERIVEVSTDPNDVVWDPFGGLCTTAAACMRMNRRCQTAEIVDKYFEIANERLSSINISLGEEQSDLKSF